MYLLQRYPSKSTPNNSNLQGISKRRRPVAHLRNLIIREIPPITRISIPLLVDPLVVEPQRHNSDKTQSNESNIQRMTEDELRSILRTVKVRRHRSSHIANTDLERHTGCTLVRASKIIRDPRDVSREGAVDARSGDEDACIDSSRRGASMRSDKRHNEANENSHHRPENIRTSRFPCLRRFIRVVTSNNCQDRSNDINRNRQQLRHLRLVPQLVDNRRHEKGDGVERADDAPVHQQAEVELPVGEGLDDEFPLEVVALGDHAAGFLAALVLQAVGCPGALFHRQEGGGVREVVHYEEGTDGHDDGEEAFEDEDLRIG